MEESRRTLKRRAGKFKSGEAKSRKQQASVERPRNAKECDANWKKLLTEIEKERSTTKETRKTRKGRSKNQGRTTEGGKPEVWFDDVPEDEILMADGVIKQPGSEACSSKAGRKLVKDNAFCGLTKAVGIDCEMVGTGQRGSHSALARVSLVNQYGKCIFDKHVKVEEEVTDYRTWVSGIRPSDLKGAEEFSVVQNEVAQILKDRVLVGHALHHDLKVLYITHPKKLIRDTSLYLPFRAYNNGKTPSLRVLSDKVLGVQVQKGEHSSVQDAQAAMKLYMMHKKQWEKELKLQKSATV